MAGLFFFFFYSLVWHGTVLYINLRAIGSARHYGRLFSWLPFSFLLKWYARFLLVGRSISNERPEKSEPFHARFSWDYFIDNLFSY